MSSQEPRYICPNCKREYASRYVLENHTPEACATNRRYDERYKRREDAATKAMHSIRTQLGDPEPDDPSKVHVRRTGD